MNDEANEETEQIGDEIGDLMTQEEDAPGDITEEGIGEESSVSLDREGEDGEVNVDLIMDLPLEMVVELGRTKMLINDLLQIGQGSVIELNKQVGEALDILVNGKLVARGEVVVVKDKFGVRITEVLSTIERIQQLA
ncbi:MAG TPA: flagellar motor switch protein FliN [Nitrospinae bacterium]|nr:flagellar motor switch protein FliN [Nitrospinota bacterium]